MARTRTPGITIDVSGKRTINKEYRALRIFARLGKMTQELAERELRTHIEQIDRNIASDKPSRPLFRHCAAQYLAESRGKRSIDSIELHVRLLLTYFADFEPRKIHDATLKPFVTARFAEGVAPTTINRSLEVVRTILNRAARAYRDEDGRPWLEAVPPLITMQPESPRQPYPITWEEQDRLFQRLPAHLARMVLFAVNTGLRDSNVCGLRWSWEVPVPEVGRSVFVVPAAAYKARRVHVVILNDAAWSIVETQRGKHPEWVFTFRDRCLGTMNNTSWQRGRQEVGLRAVRIHDLRHTFGSRLRAAGVSAEDRAALLGHANGTMTGHYASADIGRLIMLANRVLERVATRTLLRVANG